MLLMIHDSWGPGNSYVFITCLCCVFVFCYVSYYCDFFCSQLVLVSAVLPAVIILLSARSHLLSLLLICFSSHLLTPPLLPVYSLQADLFYSLLCLPVSVSPPLGLIQHLMVCSAPPRPILLPIHDIIIPPDLWMIFCVSSVWIYKVIVCTVD